jgi:hypothetical protein
LEETFMSTAAPTSVGHEPVDTLTVAQIDRELTALSTALDTCSSVEIATTFERRRQALSSARTMALVRERARARQQQAEKAVNARQAFDRLEAELPPHLRTLAQDLDQWVAEGAALLARYRETVFRLAEVEAVLVPAPLGRELHLPQLLERFTIDQSLEQALGRAGVLPGVHVFAWARDPAENSLEAYVGARLQRFFSAAAEWLPPAPAPDEDTGI